MLVPANSSGVFFFLIPGAAGRLCYASQHYLGFPTLLVFNIYSLGTILSVMGCYSPIFKITAIFLSPYMTKKFQSMWIIHFLLLLSLSLPQSSPCCGVAGAGVTFCPEAPALVQYWKFPPTKPDAFPHWCAKLSALLCQGRAGLRKKIKLKLPTTYLVSHLT